MKNELFISLFPLKTERLVIKLTTKEDIDLLLKLDKQIKTQEFLGGIKNKTHEERIEFLQRKEDKHNKGIISSLTVFLKDENIPIGFIGYKIDEENNSSEISYIFDEDYTKKGYCTESVDKIINISLEKIKISKIFADTVEKNENSKKLLIKLGFIKTTNRIENNVVFEEYEKYNN